MIKNCCGRFQPFAKSFLNSRISKMSFSYEEALSKGTVIQSKLNQEGTFIMLHGLGDTAFGWSDVCSDMIQKKGNEHIKFVLPTAPVRETPWGPSTSWYSIWDASKSPEALDLNSRSDVSINELEECRAFIENLIENENKNGIPNEKIILAGFSQGGAVSLYTAFSKKKKLAGVIALSTYFPGSTSDFKNESKDIPLLMCHGIQDNVVPYNLGKTSFDLITKDLQADSQFKSYQMGHEASLEELEEVISFCHNKLPQENKPKL